MHGLRRTASVHFWAHVPARVCRVLRGQSAAEVLHIRRVSNPMAPQTDGFSTTVFLLRRMSTIAADSCQQPTILHELFARVFRPDDCAPRRILQRFLLAQSVQRQRPTAGLLALSVQLQLFQLDLRPHIFGRKRRQSDLRERLQRLHALNRRGMAVLRLLQ